MAVTPTPFSLAEARIHFLGSFITLSCIYWMISSVRTQSEYLLSPFLVATNSQLPLEANPVTIYGFYIVQQSIKQQSSMSAFQNSARILRRQVSVFQYSDALWASISASFFLITPLIFILTNVIDCSPIYQAALGNRRYFKKSSNLTQTLCISMCVRVCDLVICSIIIKINLHYFDGLLHTIVAYNLIILKHEGAGMVLW